MSVDAEWIVAKKDYQEAKKKQKARETSGSPPQENGDASQEMPPQYQPEMDEMRCVLYAHGGRLRCFVVLLRVLIVNRRLLLR